MSDRSVNAPSSQATGAGPCGCAGGSGCRSCRQAEPRLRRKARGPSTPVAPAIVGDVLGEPGEPLDPETRSFMEPRFGADFSHVRVHADPRAAASARAVEARAYNVGSHVVLGAESTTEDSGDRQRLLAHELAHVVQQRGMPPAGQTPEIGDGAAPEEREADRMAEAAVTGAPPAPASRASAAPRLRRQPTIGWPGSGTNAKEKKTVSGMERVPLGGLSVGHQSGRAPSGEAIVVLPPKLDPDQPIQVLLHFHGHNAGYRESGGKVRDDDLDRDNIEGQLAVSAAARPQLVAILPQGTADSSFGTTTVGKKDIKSFDSDGYIKNVIGALQKLKGWKAAPSVTSVTMSGHSGAGELINEKILGSTLGSRIGKGAGPTAGSSAPAALQELALFDAVNGPNEHARLTEFLKMKLEQDLAALLGKSTEPERKAYLKGSFRFRAYYSHGPKIGDNYRRWHVGPVPPGGATTDSIQDVITKFLTDNAKALGGTTSDVYLALEANYQVIDAGAGEHDQVVGGGNRLADAVSVLPKREDGSGNQPARIPGAVRETLEASGRPFDRGTLAWANDRFGTDLSGVRVHDDDRAAHSARAIHARAYTAGPHIVFGHGHYAPATPGGRRLLAHELAHVLQQRDNRADPAALALGSQRDQLEAEADRAAETSDGFVPTATRSPSIQREPDGGAPGTLDAMCRATGNSQPVQLGTCNYKQPEHCPTYEDWLGTFTALRTFQATDTPGSHPGRFEVFGGGAAEKDFRASPKGQAPGPAPSPKSFAPLKPGERFIDHPTDEWVRTCLPENLRATAYQLPADCADVAMILRHVWLAAHHRTQKFGKWTLGELAGKADEKNVLNVIDSEGTGTVAGLVAPYADASGKPLRSIVALAPLLHPGDILVWWHFAKGFDKPRTGGHTHTIAGVQRDGTGALVDLTLLQGNEPLFGPQKADIHEFLTKENKKAAQPTDKVLGEAPGRRVEKATAHGSGLAFVDRDTGTAARPNPVWLWGTDTLLVVAGPPRSAERPPMAAAKGKTPPQRQLTDWTSSLRSAPDTALTARFEGMLYEARATVESGGSLVEAEARLVGAATGARLWELAKAAAKTGKDLGNASHYWLLLELMEILWKFRTSRPFVSRKLDQPFDDLTFRVQTQLGWIGEALEPAARGVSDVSFATGVSPKTNAVDVLVTGFDPFEPSGSLRPPARGEWNPAGAAAIALDGKRLPVADSKGGKGIAAVEGVVLPVSFDAFKGGAVERVIGPHAKEVDAVMTISEDAGLDPSRPVRLERYVVGVHVAEGKLEGVPAAEGGVIGPAIIESSAPLPGIAAAAKGNGAAPADIGEGITFTFPSLTEATGALTALGLPAPSAPEVTIADPVALHQIISTMRRVGAGAKIDFQAGARRYGAEVVSGPGGNFLSNEVSFRALRLLGSAGSTKNPISFHTHTPRSDIIPDDDGTPAGKKARQTALDQATALRVRIIETSQRMIGAVGRLALDKRAAKKP